MKKNGYDAVMRMLDQMDEMVASTKSNNWRKMHGYPLRRKMHNAHYKHKKPEKPAQKLILAGSGAGRSRYFSLPQI